VQNLSGPATVTG